MFFGITKHIILDPPISNTFNVDGDSTNSINEVFSQYISSTPSPNFGNNVIYLPVNYITRLVSIRELSNISVIYSLPYPIIIDKEKKFYVFIVYNFINQKFTVYIF